MTNFAGTYNGNPTNDAGFQNFVQQTEAALLASGMLVVAGDTGQINPTTVTMPAAGAYAGYRIYKFADATPGQMYMKVEYGIGSSTGRPGLRTTFSTATNGAGTPTGIVSSSQVVVNNNTGTATDFVGGGGGSFGGIAVLRQSTGGICWLGMTRLVQDDGAISPLAAMGITGGNSLAAYAWRCDYANAFNAAGTVLNECYPKLASTINTAGTITKVPAFRGTVTIAGESLEIPLLGVRLADAALVNSGSQFTASWRGAPHAWLPLAVTGTLGLETGTNLAMLFD